MVETTKKPRRRKVVRRVRLTDDEGRIYEGRLLVTVPAKSAAVKPPHPMADSIGAFADFPKWDEFMAIIEENRRTENESIPDDEP